ncbi:hypothetical protein ABZ234_04290 [Nocardiopsis sp. NPDC006198]|uniref:hypothetical protein n=1 Tax=Nocardiopsis sp. NPDC006198 TaxID=3154472 RepID=UPI0033BE763A
MVAPVVVALGGAALRAGAQRLGGAVASRGGAWLAGRGGWKGLMTGAAKGAGAFSLGALKLGAKAGVQGLGALGGLAMGAASGVMGAAGAAVGGATGLLSALAGAFETAGSGQSYGMSGPMLRGKGRGATPLHA